MKSSCVGVWPAGTYAVVLLRAAVFMRRRKLQFCAQELVVLCLARNWWSCVWPFVPLYFGPFWTVSSLNLMMRSSPARSRKKSMA